MNFVALDVETANADRASICQIGLAVYENGLISREWKSYVNPRDYFDPVNVSIHGIDETSVSEAPDFSALAETLYSLLDGRVALCHTSFDRVAILRAAHVHGVRVPANIWLDSSMIARRAWNQFARSGYGLSSVCEALGIDFKHHDALEDAKAAGQIFLAAIKVTGLGVDDWIKRVKQPIGPDTGQTNADARSRHAGNPDGALSGEVLVFTGALEIPRREATELAVAVGCQVDPNVTKNTTILVVGDQDIRVLAGRDKSSKHLKAEKLISEGFPIRILKETDFSAMIQMVTAPT